MKKYLFVIIMIITTCMICSCAAKTPAVSDNGSKSSKTLHVITTIFPEYDWTINVLGEKINEAKVTMLLDNSIDLHSYQPTADDILNISTCDLFIYVGGESDEWVEDVLESAQNKNIRTINLLEVLGDAAKEEELVEGMQGEEEGEEDDEEGPEYDEHVWLSVKNAAIFVDRISDELQELDPANAKTYKDNARSYIEKLDALDDRFAGLVNNATCRTLLFGDRFPFRYLTDDYGLKYYAAFIGCSAETEASFETITFLSEKIDELGLKAVMTIEGQDHRIAETIIENTRTKDQKILTLDSMQSVTSKDVKNGKTYLAVMEDNMEVLGAALQ